MYKARKPREANNAYVKDYLNTIKTKKIIKMLSSARNAVNQAGTTVKMYKKINIILILTLGLGLCNTTAELYQLSY